MERIPTERISEKEVLQRKLNSILEHELTVENIDDYAESAISDLVEIVDEVSQKYRTENPDIKDEGKILEDAAFRHYDLDNVEKYLDKAQEKAELIKQAERYIQERVIHTDEIITPPGEREASIVPGAGNFEVAGSKDRLKTLLYVLQGGNISLDNIVVTEGDVTEEMMRKTPYVIVEIPELNRVVQVCDEERNATYIFQLDVIGVDEINRMTKQEKMEWIREHPSEGVKIVYTSRWIPRIEEHLWGGFEEEKTTEKEETVIDKNLPKVSNLELDEWKNFWTDEEGKHWGTISAIRRKFGASSQETLKKLIKEANLEEKKVIDNRYREGIAFCYENIINLEQITTKQSAHEAATTGEWRGFWTDEEGKHWASRKLIGAKIGISNQLIQTITEDNWKSASIVNGNRTIEAYCFEDVMMHPKIKEILESPNAEIHGDWKGFWTDEEGKHWAPVSILRTKIPYGTRYIESQIKKLSLSQKKVKNLRGAVFNAYCFEDILNSKEHQEYNTAPNAEIHGDWKGFHLQDGNHWGSVRSIIKKTGVVSRGPVYDIIERLKLSNIKIKDPTGKLVDAYSFEDIYQDLASRGYVNVLRIESGGEWKGFAVDENKNHWAPITTLWKKFNTSEYYLYKFLESKKFTSRTIKPVAGSLADAYCYEDLIKGGIREYLKGISDE